MHQRRPVAQLSSLALVLPHPSLPKRASSIRSSTDSYSSPRTPRNSLGLPSPSLFKLDSAAPRRSTDSWNSSVHDGGDDEMDWEWTTEQIALLLKALDALPSHLLSPYNGSIPPANVLDRIARSIIHAKDPLEWPHSIRSTRIKLLKLARIHAEENDAREKRLSSDLPPDVLQPTTNVHKKPLYRQSSMDFIKGNTLKNEKSIDRLSTRLQRVDRIIPNPAYAYVHSSSRSPSPPPSGFRPNNLGDTPRTPKTPAEDVTSRGPPSSLSSSRGSRLRRSTTTMSGLPTIQSGVASDCVSSNSPSFRHAPKVKRSESFSSPSFNGLGHSLKRAPSFGSISTRSIDSSRMSVDDQKENSPQMVDIYPSSDDEEKIRSKKVKKQKTSRSSATDPTSKPTPLPKIASSATLKSDKTTTSKVSTRARKTSAKKISRTSSMFGAELPNPQPEPLLPVSSIVRPDLSFVLPVENMQVPPVTPNRKLRRVKTTNFPPRMSRRISFGHLSAPVEEEAERHSGTGLESAFQMQ
ncbi:hypothetical protein DFH11DRAFT_863706 [Phellopilus nigrolimitatus]|nr:hypothetical protein DFH11DRAFT_863706 [Phellopilus nigrolimitatus]